jgi:hypothetical protein
MRTLVLMAALVLVPRLSTGQELADPEQLWIARAVVDRTGCAGGRVRVSLTVPVSAVGGSVIQTWLLTNPVGGSGNACFNEAELRMFLRPTLSTARINELLGNLRNEMSGRIDKSEEKILASINKLTADDLLRTALASVETQVKELETKLKEVDDLRLRVQRLEEKLSVQGKRQKTP